MANLAITRRCQRGCAHCFAADECARGQLIDMPPGVFEEALNFLERSGVPDARLLGGEPLLHPAFGALATRALERGFGLTVMTGGLVPEAALAELVVLAEQAEAGRWADAARRASPMADRPRGVTVFLNAALSGRDAPALVAAQERLIAALGRRVELGVTISAALAGDPAPDGAPAPGLHAHPRGPAPDSSSGISEAASFLVERIIRHHARRSVRLGVAHPIWRGGNDSVPSANLRALGPGIEAFVARAEAAGVRVGFDCGLVPCMFSSTFAARHPRLMAQTGTRCGPIVDVLPEGDAIACFALSHAPHVTLDGDLARATIRATAGAGIRATTRADHIAVFNRWFDAQPHAGIFAECSSCTYRARGRCGGGCRGRQLARACADVPGSAISPEQCLADAGEP